MCFLGGASSQNCRNLVIVTYFLSSDYFSNAIYEFAVTLLLNVITVVTTDYRALCNLLICFQIIYLSTIHRRRVSYLVLWWTLIQRQVVRFTRYMSLNQIKKLFLQVPHLIFGREPVAAQPLESDSRTRRDRQSSQGTDMGHLHRQVLNKSFRSESEMRNDWKLVF